MHHDLPGEHFHCIVMTSIVINGLFVLVGTLMCDPQKRSARHRETLATCWPRRGLKRVSPRCCKAGGDHLHVH